MLYIDNYLYNNNLSIIIFPRRKKNVIKMIFFYHEVLHIQKKTVPLQRN